MSEQNNNENSFDETSGFAAGRQEAQRESSERDHMVSGETGAGNAEGNQNQGYGVPEQNQGYGSSYQSRQPDMGRPMGNEYSYANAQAYSAPPQKEKNGLGIASLILGILSILTFCMCVNYVLAIIAIVLGIIQLVTHKKKGLAVGGIITAVVGIILGIVFWAILIPEFKSMFRDPDFRKQVEEELKKDYGEKRAEEMMEQFDDFIGEDQD